jgi:hypothetical protein
MLPQLLGPAADLTPADQMVVQAKAVYDLARHQAWMERRLVHHDRRLDDVEEIVENLRLRMQGPDLLITDAQAGEIAAASLGSPHSHHARSRSAQGRLSTGRTPVRGRTSSQDRESAPLTAMP